MVSRYFYDNITRRGVDFDLIGLSTTVLARSASEAVVEPERSSGCARQGRYRRRDFLSMDAPGRYNNVEYCAARPDQLPEIGRFPATPFGRPLISGSSAPRWRQSRRTAVAASSTRSPDGCRRGLGPGPGRSLREPDDVRLAGRRAAVARGLPG